LRRQAIKEKKNIFPSLFFDEIETFFFIWGMREDKEKVGIINLSSHFSNLRNRKVYHK
jgi:hypothetical protein